MPRSYSSSAISAAAKLTPSPDVKAKKFPVTRSVGRSAPKRRPNRGSSKRIRLLGYVPRQEEGPQ